MNTTVLILSVLAACFWAWQISLVMLGAAYARAGRSVKIGIAPGVIGSWLAVIAVVLA